MIEIEIEEAQKTVRTDAYPMSFGEIVNMYDEGEIIIAPEFQRLFRWDIGQKSKLIESVLLGIPLPSIFVFELDNGKWELIDGLQRLSTILEFMGKLKDENGRLVPPSILKATKYLPSLHNVVWEKSVDIKDVLPEDQVELSKVFQLNIKRSRIGVEILKRPSTPSVKFDLFQRLNSGGTQANDQEVRNSIILMVNADYFREIKKCSEMNVFREIASLNGVAVEKQRDIEYVVRFLVHSFINFDGRMDVGDYIDSSIVELATNGDVVRDTDLFKKTFDLLYRSGGENALRRYEDGAYKGRVGLVGLEIIAVGVAKNLNSILLLPDPVEFVRERSRELWSDPNISAFVSPGVRGTTRIQKTIPFGEAWFRP